MFATSVAVIGWGIKLVAAALLAMLAAVPAAAAPLAVCRIATPAGTGIREMLARPPVTKCARLPAATRGTVWLDFGRPAALAQQSEDFRLLIDNHRVDAIDLYAAYADGAVRRVRYDPVAPDRSWRSGGFFSLPIAYRGPPVTRLLARLQGVELITLSRPSRLVPMRDDYRAERRDASLYGIATGMLGLTVLFHLSLFSAMRRRFQLFYCAHVAVLFVYAITYSGLIQLLIANLEAGTVSRLISAAMAAASATGLLFSIDFIDRGALPRLLRRWGLVGACLSLVMALMILVAPDALTAPVYTLANIVGLHGLAMIAIVLFTGVWRRSATARMLLLGWAVPLTFATFYPLRLLGLSTMRIPDGGLVAALTLECLILSLPVVERVKRMRLDHERARERQTVLERQAATDSMTGLANRRGFVAAIDRAVQLRGGATPIALLMIDIDHFKSLNDRHGHVRGDSVLTDVGAHVARAAGSGAIVARYGGEEFVVALTGSDMKRAATIAERIRLGVEERADELLGATVSIGVACGECQAIDRLMVDADLALYDAKRGGRNRVSIAPATERAIAA